MAHGQHKHRVLLHLVAVQRETTGLATGNDELFQPLLCAATDQWVVRQNVHGLDDEIHSSQCGHWFSLKKEIGKPTGISERALGVDHARQVFALGRAMGLPWARARRQACAVAAV